MIERIEIGSSPWGEECAQVGQKDYYIIAYRECAAYKKQLCRILRSNGFDPDTMPEGFALVVKGIQNDFGTYYEVVCRFNGDDERSWEIASFIESNAPEMWDDIAKKELGKEEVA